MKQMINMFAVLKDVLWMPFFSFKKHLRILINARKERVPERKCRVLYREGRKVYGSSHSIFVSSY